MAEHHFHLNTVWIKLQAFYVLEKVVSLKKLIKCVSNSSVYIFLFLLNKNMIKTNNIVIKNSSFKRLKIQKTWVMWQESGLNKICASLSNPWCPHVKLNINHQVLFLFCGHSDHQIQALNLSEHTTWRSLRTKSRTNKRKKGGEVLLSPSG